MVVECKVVEVHGLLDALIITIVTYLQVLSIRLLIRNVIINARAKQFSTATLAKGTHEQRHFKHNSYARNRMRGCTSVFVAIMLEHVR